MPSMDCENQSRHIIISPKTHNIDGHPIATLCFVGCDVLAVCGKIPDIDVSIVGCAS